MRVHITETCLHIYQSTQKADGSGYLKLHRHLELVIFSSFRYPVFLVRPFGI